MGNKEEAKLDTVCDEVAGLSNKEMFKEESEAEDKEFVVLIELLMMQVLKLDEIDAEGELKVRRKREVCRVQSIVESLDTLRARNSIINCSGTTQELSLPGSPSLCFSFAPKTSTIITLKWELFD